tara:strand:+ start:527 stop:952 length:426 start_codon:yes stop_codon:yes gene_type:complete
MEQIFVMAILVFIAWRRRVRLQALPADIEWRCLDRALSAQIMIGLLAAIKSLFNPWAAKPIAGNRQSPVIAKAQRIAWRGCCDFGIKPTMRGGSDDVAKRLTAKILPDLTQVFDHHLRVILQMLLAPRTGCLNGEGWRARA